jgi:hypothetical protein
LVEVLVFVDVFSDHIKLFILWGGTLQKIVENMIIPLALGDRDYPAFLQKIADYKRTSNVKL